MPRFSFLDLGGERGEEGCENFHKFLIFLTSFFLFYALKKDERQIQIALYMCKLI